MRSKMIKFAVTFVLLNGKEELVNFLQRADSIKEAIKFTQEQKSTLLDNLSFESTAGLTLGKEKIGDGIEDVSLPKVGYSTIRSILLRLKENSERNQSIQGVILHLPWKNETSINSFTHQGARLLKEINGKNQIVFGVYRLDLV